MKALHLLTSGGVGGIEVLMKNYSSRTQCDNIFLFARCGGVIEEEMRQQGIKTIVLGEEHYGLRKMLKKIQSICEEEKVDVVVSHHPDPLIRLAAISVKNMNPRIRMVLYTHSDAKDLYRDRIKIKRMIKKRIQQRAINKADTIVAISESVKNSLSQDFVVDSTKIKVVYNGIPLEQFTQSKEIDVAELQLIFIGRLIEEKGVQDIISGLRECNITYHLSIVGDGNYRTQLEALAEGLNIEFLGFRTDVSELLSTADVFVHLPKWEEGFGIAVVEAMAAGKICVCGKKGAMPEIITDGEDGFLVEGPQGLVDVLQRIVKMDKNAIKRIQENAKRTASRYSINIYAKKLDEVLKIMPEA